MIRDGGGTGSGTGTSPATPGNASRIFTPGDIERPGTPVAVATQRTIRFPDDAVEETK